MKRVFFLITIYLLLATPVFAQSVDLLWQGNTYTPPFYKGRALWTRQSRITLVAIPQGLGNAANLSYKWSRNGVVLGNINGVGKNSLAFSDTVLGKPQTIKVEVMAADGAILASASQVVIPSSPFLLLYEFNPLYGFMLHRGVGETYTIEGEETTFAAFPFFFSAGDRAASDLGYEWRSGAGEAGVGDTVTYRIPKGASGSSLVEVRAYSRDKIVQDARKSFLVQFGQ